MTKHDQVMVVSLSMMFYFQRFLFVCFKYTKWKEKDNLLNFFSVVFFVSSSAKEFRVHAFH